MGATPTIISASTQSSKILLKSVCRSIASSLDNSSNNNNCMRSYNSHSTAKRISIQDLVVDRLSTYESYCYVEEDINPPMYRHGDGIVRIMSKQWRWGEVDHCHCCDDGNNNNCIHHDNSCEKNQHHENRSQTERDSCLQSSCESSVCEIME